MARTRHRPNRTRPADPTKPRPESAPAPAPPAAPAPPPRPAGAGTEAPAAALRRFLDERNISPHAAAGAAGIHHSIPTRWYFGDRSMKLETFDALCQAYGLVLVQSAEAGRQ